MTIDWSNFGNLVNDCYKPQFQDWNRFNVNYGGSGSGKSVYITQRAIYRILTIEGYNLLTVRKYGVTNRFSTFALFQQQMSAMGVSDLFTVNKSDMTITCQNGNQILFLGLDDREKIKSLTFKTGILQAVWMEEANEFDESDLMQLDLRLRGQSPIPFQITISFNPISAYHWLKSYFFDRKVDSCTILKTTYLDNRFIDDAYKGRLNALTGTARQVYAMGEWGVTEGLVFKEVATAPIPAGAKLHGYGLDFGFSSDPAALIAVYTYDNTIHFDEVIYQTGLTNSDLSNIMKSKAIGNFSRIIADSAEPKSIEDLHRSGWNIHPAKKGPDSIRFGIDAMLSKRIAVTPESSNLLKEFFSYSWKQDKNGKYLPEPIDAFNHGLDAARYCTLDLIRGGMSVPKNNLRGALGI
jgi:phage terminase large subunit